MKTRDVLVINPILYHYRRGVFRSLDREESLRVTFASDVGGVDGIQAMPTSEVRRHVKTPVRRVGSFEWQSGLILRLLRHRYDDVIMLGNVKYISTWVAALVARARGSRVFFWTIGWHRPESGLKRILRLGFYRLADGLLLYGKTAASIGRDAGYPQERMHVIGNSVEVNEQAKDRDDFVLPVVRTAAICVGAVIRLTPVKRLELLLAAAKILQNLGHEVTVLLVGEGSEAESLTQMARELGLELHLPGAVYGLKNLTAVYELLDVTVVPAAVGLTAIQSMNHGTPVVSDDDPYTQMPEWESILPGITGELYRSGDVDDLAAAILRVHTRVQNAPLEVSRLCRAEVSENWSAHRQADKIVKVLHGPAS